MRDVTAAMDAYREAARHLWNVHLRMLAEPTQDWDVRDDFNEIAARLFRLIVLRPLGREGFDFSPDHWDSRGPFPFLHVTVKLTSEIFINRELRSGYWDFPLRAVNSGELELHFIQYFDWWDLGQKDLAFYRVRIVGSKDYPAVVGKDALVPVSSTVAVLGEAAEQADAADEVRVG